MLASVGFKSAKLTTSGLSCCTASGCRIFLALQDAASTATALAEAAAQCGSKCEEQQHRSQRHHVAVSAASSERDGRIPAVYSCFLITHCPQHTAACMLNTLSAASLLTTVHKHMASMAGFCCCNQHWRGGAMRHSAVHSPRIHATAPEAFIGSAVQ